MRYKQAICNETGLVVGLCDSSTTPLGLVQFVDSYMQGRVHQPVPALAEREAGYTVVLMPEGWTYAFGRDEGDVAAEAKRLGEPLGRFRIAVHGHYVAPVIQVVAA